MDRSARYWNRIAKRYSKQPIADEATYEKKLELTRRYFRPDSEVLEFGCGTGSTALLHAPFVKHILATDIARNMIEIARDKAVAANIGNVTFECASVEAMDLAGRSLDVVLGLNILHLLEDMDNSIGTVYKMLKPGGVFISSTACVGDMNILYRVIVPVGRFLRLFPPVEVFTVEDLKSSLTGAGFEIEQFWHPGRSTAVFIVARKPDGQR